MRTILLIVHVFLIEKFDRHLFLTFLNNISQVVSYFRDLKIALFFQVEKFCIDLNANQSPIMPKHIKVKSYNLFRIKIQQQVMTQQKLFTKKFVICSLSSSFLVIVSYKPICYEDVFYL